jgi:hypothetical protein
VDVRRLGRVRQSVPIAVALAVAVVLLALPGAAAAQTSAQTPGSTFPAPTEPGALPETPEGFEISAARAIEIANTDPHVAEETRSHGRLTTAIQTDGGLWQVGYTADGSEVAQVKVDGVTGAIREAWTGYQVAWPMARGYEGQFGHILNAPYVWIPMALVFFFCLFDFRRPLRIVHLDLLVLLSFGISQLYFNRGEIGVSVPLAYPPLIYLLCRMLWLGFRGGSGLRPTLGARWLALAAVLLIAFRVTINIADSGVIDVGYAGTIGADRIAHGERIYGEDVFPDDNRFGDTYGPANYYAYVPFELVMPWSGSWDELPASHGAAIAFDLAAAVGLAVCGMRLWPGRRGRELGAVLAFAWLAYPYTDFALQSNSNDSLIAALVIWSLAFFARPVARGALLALAVMAKFAPLALGPLYLAGDHGLLADRPTEGERTPPRGWSLKPMALFCAAFAVVAALMLAEPLIEPGLATFYERTISSQLDRTSPFSVWGQVDGIQWLQDVMFAAAAVLAIAVAFVPRRRTLPQIAALAAAVLIAIQLSVDHWFYLYIPWFFGPLAIALAASVPRERLAAD